MEVLEKYRAVAPKLRWAAPEITDLEEIPKRHFIYMRNTLIVNKDALHVPAYHEVFTRATELYSD